MIEGDHATHLGVQVPPTQYVSASYCSPERFAAYSYQIKETLNSGARTVLEVGWETDWSRIFFTGLVFKW